MAKLSEMHDIDVQSVKAFFRRIGTGFRVWDWDKRSLVNRISAVKGWESRRRLYGPTGRKAVDVRLRKKLREIGCDKDQLGDGKV